MRNIRCKICNSTDNTIYETEEMMFGYKDKFTYFQCSICECLQIAEIPHNMSKYYPSNYYSFSRKAPSRLLNIFKRRIVKIRDNYAIYDKGIIGKLIYSKFPEQGARSLSLINLTRDSRILDVGCGVGYLLCRLKELGFNNLLGIDFYLKEDIDYKNGLKILKKTIQDLDEKDDKYDLIMFHHSFEHIPDGVETLNSVRKLLSSKGCCLIITPTVSSHAWKHYGVNWVQLDAPRHFFIHSLKSMYILARKVSLDLEKIVYNSTEFQFWGSEQYLRSIPLESTKSYGKNPSNSIFSKADIKKFRRKAEQLNLKNEGDQVCFYLRKG